MQFRLLYHHICFTLAFLLLCNEHRFLPFEMFGECLLLRLKVRFLLLQIFLVPNQLRLIYTQLKLYHTCGGMKIPCRQYVLLLGQHFLVGVCQLDSQLLQLLIRLTHCAQFRILQFLYMRSS